MANKYAKHKRYPDGEPEFAKRQRDVRSCLGKKRYKISAHAKAASAKAHQERGVNLRYYFCTGCNGYHLTKKGVKQ